MPTCFPACDTKVRRYMLHASKHPPPPNPKSYSRKREDNHHRERQSVREERK